MAAASPVIFDDGGSTRIKQIQPAAGNMDSLLDALAAQADGRFVDGGGAFRCTMKVRYHELDGDQHIPVVTVPLAQADVGTIVSQNQQIVTLTFDAAFRMTIQLASAVAGVVPLVEAKNLAGQRRYVVTNAGSIATVSVNGAQVH